MSSSSSLPSQQQPKGLPGFLRRSIRTPYTDDTAFHTTESSPPRSGAPTVQTKEGQEEEEVVAVQVNDDKNRINNDLKTTTKNNGEQRRQKSSTDGEDDHSSNNGDDSSPIASVDRKFRLSLALGVDDNHNQHQQELNQANRTNTTTTSTTKPLSSNTTEDDVRSMTTNSSLNHQQTTHRERVNQRIADVLPSSSSSAKASQILPSSNVSSSSGNNNSTASREGYINKNNDEEQQLSNERNNNTEQDSNYAGDSTQRQQKEQPSSSSPKKTDRMSYKDAAFEKAMMEPVINIVELRKLGWNGIPMKHRPQAWKILLGYLPTNASRRTNTLKRKRAEYRDAIAQHYDIDDNTRTNQEQETLRQVLVDVPRTAPDIGLFRNDLIRQSLARLLYIWAMRHPASSYVQGINDLATPLIAVFLSEYYYEEEKKEGNNDDEFLEDVLDGKMLEDLSLSVVGEVEADCYWCLTNLLSGIQDHYTSDQPGVQRMVMRLEELVNRMDGALTDHLRETGVAFMQFSFKWMNCLLLREFSLKCIIRLWDTYLSEGDGGFETFHVYVCAAFLCQIGGQVRDMEFDELFPFMQNIPTSNWGDSEIEILLSQAFVLSTLFHGSDAHLVSQRG